MHPGSGGGWRSRRRPLTISTWEVTETPTGPEVWTEEQGRPRRKWHRETFSSAFRGHVVPAASAAHLRPQDQGLGFDLPDGRRFARCLRCDAWVATIAPAQPRWDVLPPIDKIDMPRRGKELRDAIVLRLISVDRGIHSVIFGLIAAGLIYLQLNLSSLDAGAKRLVDQLTKAANETGPAASQGFLVRQLEHFLNLRAHTLAILAVTAVAYCVVEGVEAVGLWLERRWAEYLTALATAGFLPFEIHELIDRITVLRATALVVNLAILVYLVWRKRLFGVRGGVSALRAELEIDHEALFAPPAIADPGDDT
jgi:uncharacterized membrane protein (DUF2068 family)